MSTAPLELLPQAAANSDAHTKGWRAAPQTTGLEDGAKAAEAQDAILWSIPWFHQFHLMEKVKDRAARSGTCSKRSPMAGAATSCFHDQIGGPSPSKGRRIHEFRPVAAVPAVRPCATDPKDPYIFDFLTLEDRSTSGSWKRIFFIQLERSAGAGTGLCLCRPAVRLQVGDRDFHIDLLFYHLKLRCFVVIDLKKGEFKPEYAGKMNFYLSVVDDQLRHGPDAPSIGLILCQDRNHIVAEYALRGVSNPSGFLSTN